MKTAKGQCKIYLLLSWLLLFPVIVFGQETSFATWTGINFENKIVAKKLHWTARFQTRNSFYPTFRTNSNFVEGGLSFSAAKFLKINGAYRLLRRSGFDRVNHTGHRWNADFNLKKKLKPFQLVFRIRTQTAYARSFSERQDLNWEGTLRFRPGIKYKLNKKWGLGLTVENFFPQPLLNGFNLSAYRIALGLNGDLKNKKKLGVKYLFESEVNQANPERLHALRIEYSINL